MASQRGIKIVAWPGFKKQSIVDSRLDQLHDVAFSPDGKRLAVVGGSPAESGVIELFSWPELRRLDSTTVGDDLLYRVAWQADGSGLVVAGPDHAIALLDDRAKQIGTIEGHSRDVTAVGILDETYLLSSSRDNTLRIWRRPDNELVRTLNNHTHEVHDIAVKPKLSTSQSPPTTFVIASSSEDRTVRFWWPVRGRLMRFAKLPSPALDIEWTPDGELLIASCADGHLRVIDPQTVQITRDVEVSSGWLHSVAVAPDGLHAVVGGTGGLLKAVAIR